MRQCLQACFMRRLLHSSARMSCPRCFSLHSTSRHERKCQLSRRQHTPVQQTHVAEELLLLGWGRPPSEKLRGPVLTASYAWT